MGNDRPFSLVVIDDDEALLAELVQRLRQNLASETVDIRTWAPVDGEQPLKIFEGLVDDETVLVVTDYDLTRKGVTGFFGVTIVSWCQARSIPVGDFSRGNATSLPREPNLFELRVPTDVDDAAAYVASIYRGFKQLRDLLTQDAATLMSMRSPAGVLAALLDHPHLEGQFSLYMSRLGAANSSLLDRIRLVLSEDQTVRHAEKVQLLAYVIGHVLANAVLRYPGPILSEKALCAYLATTDDEAGTIGALFSESRYAGPFSTDAAFYWRTSVDETLDRAAADLHGAIFPTSGAFNRAALETVLNRPLASHSCTRCEGTNGGYLCPFTDRPVCERADCSVGANSWVPAGADLCRIERDFYEEWAPLLGL
jgi:hypothetical protein